MRTPAPWRGSSRRAWPMRAHRTAIRWGARPRRPPPPGADAPSAHPLEGTAGTLATLGRDRVAWFHERFYRPDDAVLVIGGDLSLDDAFALADRVVGGRRAPARGVARRRAR